MGKILSVASRKINRVNIENRAQNIISKPKPVMAPKFPSTVRDMDRVMIMYPNLIDELSRKDQTLDDRLKQVFVKRLDEPLEEGASFPTKQMPHDRNTPEDFEYGFKEPEPLKVAMGKCTLRQVMQFLTDHQTNPEHWTAERIANQYKLKESNVDDLLKFFKAFHIHIPNKDGKGQLLIEPNLSKQYLAQEEHK